MRVFPVAHVWGRAVLWCAVPINYHGRPYGAARLGFTIRHARDRCIYALD